MEHGRALALARALMAEHGLHGWSVVIDRAKTRAGVCRFGTRQIGLSGPLTRLHSDEDVRDTILHEIAHALVGPEHGHDAVWRRQAQAIGCSGERCVAADAPRVPGAWVGVCPAGHQVTRHRRPRRVQSCHRCSASFSPSDLFTWTHLGHRAPMHPSYIAEMRLLRATYPEAFAPTTGTTEFAGMGRSALAEDRCGAKAVGKPAATRSVEIGDRVRITKPGPYLGVIGVVELAGAHRLQVRVDRGVLAVPHELAELA